MAENERSSRMDTAINKVDGSEPNFLAKYISEDNSLDTLQEHRTVPRFKILQPTTDNDLKRDFGEGSVIIRPGDALICKHGAEPSSFEFVPLFFFVEYAKWRDLKDNSGQMVVERSFDISSEIAQRAKDANKRREPYPNQPTNLSEDDKKYYTYVEHLRFVGVVYGDHPLAGTPVTLSFERGEWGQGKNFISAVTLRRQIINGKPTSIPLWAQVWQFSVVYHNPDQKRKWYGLKFSSPENSIVKESEAADMQALHKEFKELYEKQCLTVLDEEDSSPDEAAVKANEDF